MIKIQDIETAVAKVLTAKGHTVTASEIQQGFTKPTFFIEVLPVSVEIRNQYSELITDSIEITYHPAVETREQLVEMSENIKNMFLYKPIHVNDRFLSVNEITFDTDKSALVAYFELEFIQEANVSVPYVPKMQNIEISERTDSSGTSQNTD